MDKADTTAVQPVRRGRAGWLWLGFAVLLGMLLLLMVQIDRQWERMTQIVHTLDEQAQDLRHTRNTLRELEADLRSGGMAVHTDKTVQPQEVPVRADAFDRARWMAQQPDYASGDWLVQAFATGLKTITPIVSTDAYASDVQSYVLETLLTRDPDTLEWKGLLAEDWSISGDGMRILFTLRRGMTFSDGEPLTAADVAFSFAFIMDERIAAPRYRAYLKKLKSVTALDDYHVEFVFAEPYFNSLALAGGFEVLAQHFYRRFLDNPRLFNESKGLLLGSGPYRLRDPESWTPDQGQVELERNPRYWGPVEPSFDRLVWRIIENDSARLTSFHNRDIDVYGALPREFQKLVNDKQMAGRARHFEYMNPFAGYSYIAWNQRRGDQATIFADRRVRMAMSCLTDVDKLIADIMLGHAVQAMSPFTVSSPQHDAILQPIKYNLQRAQALLKEAGFADTDGDGILEGPDGKKLEFELIFFQGSDDSRRMVLFLKDLYARAGVAMKPQPTEWSVMLEKMQRRDIDAIMLGWTSGIEVDIFQMFHSSQISDGGDNFISYSNPKLDRLLDAARAEVVEEKRMKLWHQAEAILLEDQPYTFLISRKTLVFIDKRIQGLNVGKTGLNLSYTPLEVYVPASLQRKRK